jgi:hypothetical protein
VPKVINVVGRTVELLRWKLLPDNRVISPRGVLADELPHDVAYSHQAKHLADQGLITIQGYTLVQAPEVEAPPEPVVLEMVLPGVDDLTDLANIGASRAKKLESAEVHTFQSLVDFGAEALAYLLQIEVAVAESIVEEAVSKLGAGE